MSDSCLIKGAIVVSDGTSARTDVRLDAGRIVEIGPSLQAAAANVFDATGLHLLPGLIDDQVHFREPGMTHKAELATETAAAVTGGVTSYLEMPNTLPLTTTATHLQNKLDRAAKVSQANYGFYLGATGDNNDALHDVTQAQACGIKVFLGASTGDLLVSEQATLASVFAAVPPGIVLAAHCENHARILERTASHVTEYGDNLPMSCHPLIRDAEACYLATRQAIDLAHKHNTRLHVLHLSTARELELFASGDLSNKLVTAEACVHHLWFSDADYARLGGRIKCNPSIKSVADRASLRAALTRGTIDVVATDHAPHLLTEKTGTYHEIAAGLPLIEHSLLVLLELVHDHVLSLIDIARLGAHNPAALFGIRDRGHIRVDQYADLVLIDLAGSTPASDATARSKCGWTPFAGHTFPALIEAVWVSGRLAYAGGELLPGTGMQLEYQQ